MNKRRKYIKKLMMGGRGDDVRRVSVCCMCEWKQREPVGERLKERERDLI